MKKPEIEQYLLIACSLIMDELNEQYGYPTKELKSIVNERFSETDLSMRLGHPFRQMVHYNVVDINESNEAQKNHDLFIESKGFKVEVKLLKNWKSNSKTNSNSKVWTEFERDFKWIIRELQNGSKGKCAFVIGWFNYAEYFAELIQLGKRSDGKRTGCKPLADETRIAYFPFLKIVKKPIYTKDLIYDYNCAYDVLSLHLTDRDVPNLNCIFLGSETDVFHFAIYY